MFENLCYISSRSVIDKFEKQKYSAQRQAPANWEIVADTCRAQGVSSEKTAAVTLEEKSFLSMRSTRSCACCKLLGTCFPASRLARPACTCARKAFHPCKYIALYVSRTAHMVPHLVFIIRLHLFPEGSGSFVCHQVGYIWIPIFVKNLI